MSEADETQTRGESGEQRTFTQEELNAIVGERLAREREKYADYDELRDKAEAYDKAAEESKSELQKAVERAEKAEKAMAAMKAEREREALVAEVAKAKGVDAQLLHGDTREELEAHADAIKAFAASRQGGAGIPDNGEVGRHPGKKTTASMFADAVNNK